MFAIEMLKMNQFCVQIAQIEAYFWGMVINYVCTKTTIFRHYFYHVPKLGRLYYRNPNKYLQLLLFFSCSLKIVQRTVF